MNHLTDPVTGRADPACCCFACVKRAVRRVMDAEREELDRQALDRMLRDMAQPHCQRGPWNYKPGHADDATCQRLREFFDADQ